MRAATLSLLIALAVTSAHANKLIAPGPVTPIAKSSFSAKPAGEWNRLNLREGKHTETWTLDGPLLNRVDFFGGVAVGQPLFRETDKKRQPLPKVSSGMLITDIPVLLETTYRAQLRAKRLDINEQEPAMFGAAKGVRFTYRFVRADDDVERRGEALAAVKGDKLYLITYEAPALHFFEKDIVRFRALAATIAF